SFLIVLVSVSIGELIADRPPIRAVAARLVLPAAALLAALAYGERALVVERSASAGADTRTVAVVQANLSSASRWRRVDAERALPTYSRLSLAPAHEAVDLFVWPEYAASLYLDREPLIRAQLAPVAGAARDGLVLGAPHLVRAGEARNSAYLLGAG